VGRLLEAREKHWSGHPNFLVPTLTVISQVEGILSAGLPADTVVEVADRYMGRDAEEASRPRRLAATRWTIT